MFLLTHYLNVGNGVDADVVLVAYTIVGCVVIAAVVAAVAVVIVAAAVAAADDGDDDDVNVKGFAFAVVADVFVFVTNLDLIFVLLVQLIGFSPKIEILEEKGREI